MYRSFMVLRPVPFSLSKILESVYLQAQIAENRFVFYCVFRFGGGCVVKVAEICVFWRFNVCAICWFFAVFCGFGSCVFFFRK